MKKLVVRIFNILFIIGAGVAVFSFATQPLFELEVSATIKKETVGQLTESFTKEDESSDNPEDQNGGGGIVDQGDSYIVRGITREDKTEGSSQFDLKSALSPEKVANAVGDITLTIPLKIEAKQCFDLTNGKVFNEVIQNNIGPVIENTVNTISPLFKNLVTTVTLDFAKEVMKEQVAAQVLENFKENIPVDEEKIDKLVDSIYEKLDKGEGETTTIKDLSNAILGEKKYIKAVGVTEHTNFQEKNYYVIVEQEYIKAESFQADVEYYVEDFGDGVRGILQDIQEKQSELGEEVTQINFEKIDMTEIENQMGDALDSIPNLTQHPLAEPQPTEETFGLAKYYVKNDLGGYEIATKYDSTSVYYTDEVFINNIDDALIGLLDLLSGKMGGDPAPQIQEIPNTEGGEQTNAIVRAHVNKAEESQGDRVSEKVKSVIYTLVPFDDFMKTDLSLNGYAPYILFALVFLGILPWLLFILVSLIRTIRPNKCWTKTWIVIVFAFLQVVFGIALTYGLKFAMPAISGAVDRISIPAPGGNGEETALGKVMTGLNISLQTSAFIPSIIYLLFIPLSIIFIIVRHSVVRDYKQMKEDKKAQKREAKLAKKAAH